MIEYLRDEVNMFVDLAFTWKVVPRPRWQSYFSAFALSSFPIWSAIFSGSSVSEHENDDGYMFACAKVPTTFFRQMFAHLQAI